MKSRNAVLGSVIAVLGVLMLGAAAILYWVVVPNQKQLPGDTNTTRQYEGTAKVLLNPQALATNDVAHAFIRDAPATASRTVKVLATDGGAAQVSDARTVTVGGQQVGATSVNYAVDRKSLEAAGEYPPDWTVVPHQGLTVSWPIGAEQQDYTGWVNETQTSVPIRYVRQEAKGGVNTYVYEATVPASPIKDQQVLSSLPPALPASTLGALSAVLPIPDELKAQLATVLPSLTQPVPLSYTYEATSTFWVAPETGIVVDVQREEIRRAGVSLGGPAPVFTVPIYDVVTQSTQQSVTDAANEASSDGDRLTLFGSTLPLILLTLGALALIGGILLIVLGRKGRTTPSSEPSVDARPRSEPPPGS